jgi:hypothetical protein
MSFKRFFYEDYKSKGNTNMKSIPGIFLSQWMYQWGKPHCWYPHSCGEFG